MHYIGIDPGKSGGIAIIDVNGKMLVVSNMPPTEGDLYAFMQTRTIPALSRAVLERAQGGLFAGKAGRMGVSSAFSFGMNYGSIRMALIAAEIRFDVVNASEWQRAMRCQSHGDKNITKARAQQLFPGLTITHAIADALLLAEFCRRMERSNAGVTHGKEEQEDAQANAQKVAALPLDEGRNRRAVAALGRRS